MKYVTIDDGEVKFSQYGTTPVTTGRSLSFVLTDPAAWDTRKFMELLWRKAGGVIEQVTRSRYRNPATYELAHCYHIEFRVFHQSCKVGFALRMDQVNGVMREIENEMDLTMSVRFRSRH